VEAVVPLLLVSTKLVSLVSARKGVVLRAWLKTAGKGQGYKESATDITRLPVNNQSHLALPKKKLGYVLCGRQEASLDFESTSFVSTKYHTMDT
jgi:hypothetical protein